MTEPSWNVIMALASITERCIEAMENRSDTGEVAEWPNAAVSKCVMNRGFLEARK